MTFREGVIREKPNVAPSFDRLRMRSFVLKDLGLMVSLSNHAQQRFSAA
jgi:hypothetical protein